MRQKPEWQVPALPVLLAAAMVWFLAALAGVMFAHMVRAAWLAWPWF